MGSSSLDAAKLKQIEDALVGTGYKLLKCFESSDEILIHLKVAKEVAATGDDKVSKHEFANKENDSGPSEAKEKERGSNIVKKTIRKEVSGDKEKRKNSEADLEKKIDSEDEESDVELLSTFMKIMKSKAKRKCCSAPKKIKTAPSVDKGNEIDSSADSEKQNESLLHKTRDEVISLKNGPNDVTNKENDCGLPSKLQKISTSKKTVKEKARIEKRKRIDNGSDSEENVGSLFCRRSQKHEGKSSEDKESDSELSLKLKKILKSKVKGRRSSAPNKIKSLSVDKGKGIDSKELGNEVKGRRSDAGKKGIAISGSTSVSVSAQKGKGILIDNDSAEKDGLLIVKHLERKETGKIIIPEKLNSEKVAGKNNSRRSGADYDGERLLNMRIKVFWPKNKKFCAGTIDCYDPSVKMHMVNYDNGVIEILDLREVIWKPLNEAQEANLPSPSSNAKEQVNKSGEKGSKRKPDSTSSKQLAPSSSKRSKTKN